MKQQKELLGSFGRAFPRCSALPILPVSVDGKTFVDGFDSEDVQGYLGATRYNKLISQYVKAVFCCAHRLWPSTHAEPAKRNAEVHCIYAADLERFLKDGN
jgi:hypothetical protein